MPARTPLFVFPLLANVSPPREGTKCSTKGDTLGAPRSRMRAAAPAALALALLVLAAGVPADAKPIHAGPKIVRHTLRDTGETAVMLLAEARALVPPLPTRNGELEIRAVLTQPAVRGVDETMAVLWVAAKGGTWKGAYWAEGTAGNFAPHYLEIDEVGVLLYLEGAALAQGDTVDATYRFLGVDGRLQARPLGPIPVLGEMPVLDRVDIGGALAVEREDLPAILITPWNLHDHDVTMGLTLRAGDDAIETYVAPACADVNATSTEAGCRLLYVLPIPAALTHLDVWHLEDGARVVDRTLERASLLAGETFTP